MEGEESLTVVSRELFTFSVPFEEQHACADVLMGLVSYSQDAWLMWRVCSLSAV